MNSEKLDRINNINKTKWVEYSKATQILSSLEDLLNFPTTNRMPNILVVGETNSGKTEILKRFLKLNEPQVILGRDYLFAPVLYIQAPPTPDEHRLYNTILSKLRIPHKERSNIDFKSRLTIESLNNIDCKILIIDEIHHMLAASPLKQRAALNTLKYLSSETGISIVGAGLIDAYRVIGSDDQLANRFVPVQVDKWSLNEEYAQLLITLKNSFKLRNDNGQITIEEYKYVLEQTDGLLGEISNFMKKVAIESIKNGKEAISLAQMKSIQWIPPNKRRSNF